MRLNGPDTDIKIYCNFSVFIRLMAKNYLSLHQGNIINLPTTPLEVLPLEGRKLLTELLISILPVAVIREP